MKLHIILLTLTAALVACGDDDSSTVAPANNNTAGTTGTGTGGTSKTVTPRKSPPPKPAAAAPKGTPTDTDVVAAFETACFDITAADAKLPDTFYLTELGDGAACAESLTYADITSQCGNAETDAVWVLDSSQCVIGVYFPDCMAAATGAEGLVIVMGEYYALVELYGPGDSLLCAWDPRGTDDFGSGGLEATGGVMNGTGGDGTGGNDCGACDVVCDDGTPFDYNWVCDGEWDCAGGEDEELCP